MRFLFFILFISPIYGETSKILCELDGTYSVTYKDIKKSYISEGIELFKNLAKQTQQSLFLLQRAKTNLLKKIGKKIKYISFSTGRLILRKKLLNHSHILLSLLQYGLIQMQSGELQNLKLALL